MSNELRITFEMELDRAEEHIPTQRLRMMWEYAMDLIENLQGVTEEMKELDLNKCSTCFYHSVMIFP